MRESRVWVSSHEVNSYTRRGHWRNIPEDVDAFEIYIDDSPDYNGVAEIMYDPQHPDSLRLGIDYFI